MSTDCRLRVEAMITTVLRFSGHTEDLDPVNFMAKCVVSSSGTTGLLDITQIMPKRFKL